MIWTSFKTMNETLLALPAKETCAIAAQIINAVELGCLKSHRASSSLHPRPPSMDQLPLPIAHESATNSLTSCSGYGLLVHARHTLSQRYLYSSPPVWPQINQISHRLLRCDGSSHRLSPHPTYIVGFFWSSQASNALSKEFLLSRAPRSWS